MICPVDKTPMLALEWDEIEVDYCGACGGLWLDAGELELLLGAEAGAEAALGGFSAVSGGGEKARRCPICRARMTKQRAEDAGEVLVDACPNGHGLWLDAGELDAFVRAAASADAAESTAPAREMARFLKAMFDGAPAREEAP